MEELLHHLIGGSSHYLQGFTSQVVQDFFHQQHVLAERKRLHSRVHAKHLSILAAIRTAKKRIVVDFVGL